MNLLNETMDKKPPEASIGNKNPYTNVGNKLINDIYQNYMIVAPAWVWCPPSSWKRTHVQGPSLPRRPVI